ncbi:hypothetical protein EMCRGX_G013517 [Ephydatia muelleri]
MERPEQLRRGYRQYLRDPLVPVPRTTMWNHQKTKRPKVHHSVDNEDLTSASHHDSGECSTSDQRDADLPVAIDTGIMDSNEENQEAIDFDGSMHVFEAERGDDMYTSGASDDASELSRPVSENDSDSEEEYSHSSSSEQEEEPMSCTLNMESIPESSFEPLYNGSTVTFAVSVHRLAMEQQTVKIAVQKYGNMIHISIAKSLQTIVSRNWTELEAHKPHTEHDTIDDIWSGDTLRKDADLQTNSFLALGISTDGVALFKSSKTFLWPVYLLIQNLPPQVRFKGENIILCGIWQGSRKPDMNVLLKPVVKSIQQLKEHGVIIQTPIGPKLYHAKLVLGIFDAPAKASVLCEKQFNGEFGCPTCLHPGKRIQNDARVYLPKKYPIRTHKDVIDDGMEALRTGFNIKSCVKSLFGTVSMEMRRNITRGHSCIWFCTGESSTRIPMLRLTIRSVQHLQGYPP